ncbi:MAG: tRNA (N(6)-L-threonylcarbamoyladenosine(37)-C(2))-methylthiotransferase MtaB [Rhizobiales bacterium]|nr:tRNA (N(6)-L-threonylcarbamoyladenosine(37)-C(2))-methylthiotransferase MtaB [Hyphomicrobiales bacterium]
MPGPETITFGCRLNTFESELIRARAAEAEADDTIVFNTCAVTSEAVRQAKQSIRRARRENPGARIVVTGCAAQVDADDFAAMPQVDMVLGNQEKFLADSYRADLGGPKTRVGDIMAASRAAPGLVQGYAERTRAFVQVQNGCDHRCTFCIIPYGRGNSRSVTPDHVINQVRTLVERGYAEIVLTGVDLTSYGPDLGPDHSLGQLVLQILRDIPELQRLRLSSIDSIEADEALMRALAEHERLMPQLHLSLQAGDNMILKRMKRRHSREDAIRFCNEARRLRPDVVFGADLIAGFPTETEEMFQNSLKLVEDCQIVQQLHVFPYSPRPGTPAARMPQLDGSVKKERAARLREAGEKLQGAWLEGQIGSVKPVLVETGTMGRTTQHARVEVAADDAVGKIVNVALTGQAGGRLSGHLAA